MKYCGGLFAVLIIYMLLVAVFNMSSGELIHKRGWGSLRKRRGIPVVPRGNGPRRRSLCIDAVPGRTGTAPREFSVGGKLVMIGVMARRSGFQLVSSRSTHYVRQHIRPGPARNHVESEYTRPSTVPQRHGDQIRSSSGSPGSNVPGGETEWIPDADTQAMAALTGLMRALP